MTNGTYVFTKYKQKLISKGIGKSPRVISIPTVRDKITLSIIKDIIAYIYKNEVSYSIIHKMIKDIVDTINSNNYDYYFKIDLSQFYDTIDHDILLSKLRRKIRKKSLLNLIEKAIKTPTVDEAYSKHSKTSNEKGVPQGLSISNILASLYLASFDKKHYPSSDYKYFRFVDDILILCNKKDFDKLKNKIILELQQKLLLIVNHEKSESGEITKNKIPYLGYLLCSKTISVRPGSIKKLENSLEKLFKDYVVFKKYKRNLFLWKLNIKITGLIKDKNKLGWVFFFSQITDLKLLFHFDWLIERYCKRFGLEEEIKGGNVKKYVRAMHEIKLNLNQTKYIPNFDNYSVNQKRSFFDQVFEIDTTLYDDEMIVEMFEKETYKYIKELERDLQHFS